MNIAIDPFGNSINVPDKLCDKKDIAFDIKDIFDDVQDVIIKPAIVLASLEKPLTNFYYRSIGWNYVLLIGTHKINEDWVAYQCIINPDTKFLSALFKQCRQIL